jgi:hypothetical protein
LVALGLRKSRACGALGHGRFGQRDPILVGKKVTQRGGPTTSEPATRGQRREHQTARFLWPLGQAPERNQEDGAEVVAPAPRSVLTESTRRGRDGPDDLGPRIKDSRRDAGKTSDGARVWKPPTGMRAPSGGATEWSWAVRAWRGKKQQWAEC